MEPLPADEAIDEEDLVTIRPTGLQKAAGGAQLFVGLFGLILALQTFGMARLRTEILIVLAVMVALGASLLVSGWATTRGRGAGSLVGAVAGGLQGVLGLGWLVFSFSHGLFSLVALFLPFAALAAAVFSGLSLPQGIRADDARARLRAQGFDAGS
jgi:hypothetical protein